MPSTFDERGASMVEAALAAALAFLLIFGVFQTALFARAHLVAKDGATDGAQAGSIAANDSTADYEILRAIARATAASSHGAIQKIVVYKGSGPGSDVPASCLTAGAQAGVCNVYTADDLDVAQAEFTGSSYTKDDAWPATSRAASRSAGPDHLGVHVEVKCRCAGGFVLPQLLEETAVVRLQATVP
jgi:Flp pilus assembly protein TadG